MGKATTNDFTHRHPYRKFESTPLWSSVEQTIKDLEENQDLKLLTPPSYVVGYICKQLIESGIAIPSATR